MIDSIYFSRSIKNHIIKLKSKMYNIWMSEQGLKMNLHGNKLLILKKIKKISTWVLTVLKERTII